MTESKPKRTKGFWFVVRDCCRSGNCVECRGVTPLGKPLRIIQATGYGKQYAQWVARNWRNYNAVADLDRGVR